MKLFIKTTTNFFMIEVQNCNTIYDIKLKLQNTERLPIEDQQLFFNDNTLDDDKQIDFYNIIEQSTLYLITNLNSHNLH
jgi:hypothetical protein